MTADDTVYLSSGGAKQAYHVDPDCPRIQTEAVEKPRAALFDDMPACRECSGQYDRAEPAVCDACGGYLDADGDCTKCATGRFGGEGVDALLD